MGSGLNSNYIYLGRWRDGLGQQIETGNFEFSNLVLYLVLITNSFLNLAKNCKINQVKLAEDTNALYS